jgi:hypothetical protein
LWVGVATKPYPEIADDHPQSRPLRQLSGQALRGRLR